MGRKADAKSQRTGTDTRAEVQRVALELFSKYGYEATSMQRIADEVGIKKPSLYYHFAGKEEIVRSLLTGRSDEARELGDWVRAQPASPELVREAVTTWIDSFSIEKLRGIRFMNANPVLVRTFAADAGADVGEALGAMAQVLLPVGMSPQRRILARMAFLSIRTAVEAADDMTVDDADIIAAARASALALINAAFADTESEIAPESRRTQR
ncbi:TetR/AcrR family transcriptional regulator [Gryllotalpicola reticulitermitis]|uniref:TetR/AcrR family transcriptional regulator n=1 Tax=Gryllotalpicola reticulitermitis TaxID=1184153 RepID=A0ABV8QAI9_9MICO